MRNEIRWILRRSFLTRKTLFFTAALAILLFLLPRYAYSEEVVLSWDPNQESDLSGYRIYYGTTSGSHSVMVDVGNATTYTLTNLESDKTFYFSATAYDTSGNESEFSEEISFHLPADDSGGTNSGQDSDSDGIEDAADNCPNNANANQADTDGDGMGDACDPLTDSDGDGIADAADNCPNDPNKTEPGECGCGVPEDSCGITDADGDGVPDDQDDFPYNADEYLDTDGDGEGNNADTDDDNDGMPDDWELTYGLNPLEDDADSDPDGDDVSNINEFNLGTAPNHAEGNFMPDPPALMMPEDGATVSLTPQFETGDFSDPNVNDDHRRTQWMVIRAFDGVCVFDVTSDSALTQLTLPKQILEEDTEYIWKARFIDNHDRPSEWSEEREFVSGPADHDTDKDGVPDDQEISDTLDLDADGIVDIDQTGIKCVSMPDEDDQAQICISIKDAQNVESVVSLEVQDPADVELNSATNGKPNYFEFGLLDFKLLVSNPGDETTVTIYLSRPAYTKGNIFKFDPVNEIWSDYSGYTEFSDSRQVIYLTLRDGGFGDADGIENGIIVDPLAFGSETDPSGGGSGSSLIEQVVDGIVPSDLGCFITTASAPLNDGRPRSLWHEIRWREPAIIFIVILVGFLAKVVFSGVRKNGRFV